MLNNDRVAEALERYRESFEARWPGERYKWEAVKWFQDHWDITAEDFAAMLSAATEKTQNLLASINNFPRKMIIEYAKRDREAVRAMFINLYDETKNVVDRVIKFQKDAAELCGRLTPDKQHYQRPMAITVYLWLRYPDKYDIFKYSVCKGTCEYLENEFVPRKGNTAQNITGNMKLIDELLKAVNRDRELLRLFAAQLGDNCYRDDSHRTLAFDVSFYIANYLNKRTETAGSWIGEDYDPGITKAQWLELLDDRKIFNGQALEIMARMYDYGGQATCSQLSTRYGETANFYNSGSTALAKRIADKMGCKLRTDEDGQERRWPVLYLGRAAEKDEEGAFVWKLREELRAALEETDLSGVELYADSSEEDRRYWWLNANPRIWSFSEISIGEEQAYTLYNDNGNKRRIFQNFLDAREGDLVICYESNPVKQIVALARVTQENDGENLYFEKVEGLSVPIDYIALREAAELERMEYFLNPQGSLFKLTKGEYDFIMDMIREENPVVDIISEEPYTREDFLKEVYISEEKYETLRNLLLRKQNIILQGAPGVGKTYAAKRLAYSLMGVKDDSRVEFVQFHQNYAYEDFIMGYKPNGEGFELRHGVFYKFCQRAANNPELPYFFIIDEINRGNMSKIFGELLMLIEKDYRGTKATLAYSGLPFSVPKNLYVIGMMNTADRSLAMIDYALRRRFSFFAMEPGFETEGFREYIETLQDDTLEELIDVVVSLNRAIAQDASLGKGFCIGHSYFCGQQRADEEEMLGWMSAVVDYDIVPMLEEYWFDEPDKVAFWRNRLQGVFNS